MELLTSKVNIRWLKILNAFERRNELTTAELSDITEATTRTVVSDISSIKSYFGDSMSIESRNSGYRFIELLPEEYTIKKREILDDEPLFTIITAIFLGENRRSIDWADKLYRSNKSMMIILKKLQEIVKEYGFKLTYNPVDFVGSEQNIRKFFLDFFYEGDVTPHTLTPSISIQNIVREFSVIYEQNKPIVIQFSKFCYLLLIMFKRRQYKDDVTFSKEIRKKVKEDIDFKYVEKLNEIILKTEQFTLSENELIYLMILWITNRNIEDVEASNQYIQNYMNNPLLLEFSNDYCKMAEIELDDNQAVFIQAFFLSYYLKNLLSPAYIRNLSDITVYVKKYYAAELQANYDFFKTNPNFKLIFKKKIAFDLAVNLTLFMDSLKKTYQFKRKNVGFLLEGNQNMCLNIWATASKCLGSYHNLYFLDVQTFTEEFIKKNKIDFIVTNYSDYVSNQVFKMNYILFKSIPTPEDWKSVLYKMGPSTILGKALDVDADK